MTDAKETRVPAATATAGASSATVTAAAPVTAAERIVSLDVLRGFAILGILIMNVQSFSMIGAAYLNPTAYGDLTGLNRVVWTLSHLFADMKFITIFSMLFGAGIVLFATRLESRGLRPGPVHYRRTFWLLLIGLAHGFLLWYGDILAIYALTGFIAYLFWRRSPLALLITGIAVMSVGTLLYVGAGVGIMMAPPEALEGIRDFWSPGAERVAHEVAAMRGSWTEQMSVRGPEMVSTFTVVFFMYYLWRTVGMMLIGMALFKWGVLSAERSKRFYAVTAVVGFVVGLPVIWLGVARRFADGWTLPWSFFNGSQYNYWGSAFVALAYISVVMLVVKTDVLGRLRRALAAAGRMAFTNYLMQTVICTAIFYGHGLGLFGSVERVHQILIVFAVWIFQLWFSAFWLERFRFGPAEWVWRTLTYLKPQPMKR
ncbi:MAG: DUF418 domain-containing protein [Candidatus Eisenbacteria sp.]|nr:DUF418 domain-containing protein [Candidatus Eisenbacteria bacterium]